MLEKSNPNFKWTCTMTEMSKSKKEWQGETGLINKEMLARHLTTLQGPIYYSAGPPAMVTGMRKILLGAGIDEDDIRTEEFAGYEACRPVVGWLWVEQEGEIFEVSSMLANKPKTKILVDGGDPNETLRIKGLIGFVDGQTTNPSLIAKNPEVQRLVASGHRLSSQEENDEYKKIVQSISPLVGDAGVSIEVFADLGTRAEEMLAQGQEMFSWIPNAYIKYPCTHEGLQAAQMSVQKSIRVNITLCFSQEQAAAVYAATKGSKEPVYVSPFIGRPDDHGEDGMDLVRNIKKMYKNSDGHVHVLGASIRNVNHLLCSFALSAELATVPTKLLEEWAATGFPMPDQNFSYKGVDASGKLLKTIPYKELDLNLSWQSFDIAHELTTKGIQKFVADYQSTLRRSA